MRELGLGQWQVLSPYLDQALECSPEERAAWLSSLRQQNPGLADQLQALLNEHRALDEQRFLDDKVETAIHRSSPAGQTVGAYVLQSPIGQGGMGTVWLARRADGRFEGRAAIKFLNLALLGPLGEARFKREGSILARLAHPNVARLLDAGVSEAGQPYLVLEYVEGRHIDDYCNSRSLEAEARLRLFLSVLAAVSHAHTNLIVHRDIKPSNVLVTNDGQVKLLDFGIAKLLESDAPSAGATALTREGGQVLSLAYAAPEQVTGTPVTTATDIYSLGLLLYVLLAGKHPAERHLRSPVDLMKAIVETVPPRASDAVASTTKLRRVLRGDVDTIIAKALKKNPAERYASATALAEDIRRYLDHQPISARPDTMAYRTRKFVRRHRIAVAVAALVIAGLSIGLYLVNRERAIAQRRFLEVRQLANKLLDIDVEVRRLPGSTKTRQLIVDTSLEYLRRLSAEVRGDPELSLEVGNAYLRVARVQGVPITSNLGQLDEAEKTLRIAEGFVQSVLALQPANRTAFLRSAQIAHDRMILARLSHRYDEALAFAGKSAEWLEKFHAGKNDESEATAVLTTYLNVAQQYALEQQLDDALRLAGRGIEAARAFDSKSYAGNFLWVSADALQRRGDLDEALQKIRESVSVLEAGPESTEKGQALNLVMALLAEGRILGGDGISLGRSEEAVASLERAFNIADQFVHSDPNDQSPRGRLGMAGIDLADILRSSDARRALDVYEHTRRHAAEVNNLNSQGFQVSALSGSSYALRRLGRLSEARQQLDAALALLGQMKMYPAEKIILGSVADKALRALAVHESETGNATRAIEICQELLDRAAPASPNPGGSLQDAVHLSHIYAAKADFHRRAGQADLASALDSRRLELWHQWEQKLPGNSFVLRQLAAKPASL